MASGDTKTEAMLNVLGNGGSGDEFRGCCNTKTQQYILDAIDRINAIQPGGSSDFNDLENRPQLNSMAMTGNTNITDFVGTDGQTAGAQGLVPAPATTDADKFLKSDGTWATAGGGGGPTVVQTIGSSQTDVMSQKATSYMLFPNSNQPSRVRISTTLDTLGDSSVAIGWNAMAFGDCALALGPSAVSNVDRAIAIGYGSYGGYRSIAIGNNSNASQGNYSVALGAGAECTRNGEIYVGNSAYPTSGYDGTAYRVIGGVHDAVDNHDAVTLGQLNTLITNLNQALGTAIPLLGNANNANNNSGSAQTVTCPFCGSDTSAESTICENCGADMTQSPYDPGAGEEPGLEEPVDPGEEPVFPGDEPTEPTEPGEEPGPEEVEAPEEG